MLWIDVLTPFVIFFTFYSLKSDYVGVFPVQAAGLVSPVKINQQLHFGSFQPHFFIIVHHLLIGSLHKINLDSGHAPIPIKGKYSRNILLKGFPQDPQDEPDTFVFAVTYKLLHIQQVI